MDRMFKNRYINLKDLEYKNKSIKIYKRTENYFLKADYYYEEIRKKLFKEYGTNQLYSDGLIIKTSINSNIQNFADQSLQEGIIDYDKKRGWRGILGNYTLSNFNQNQQKFNEFNPFVNRWIPVIILENNKNKLIAKDHFNKDYNINLNDYDNIWLKNEAFKKGDIVFIEIINNNAIIRQIPEVNGAIVVINPHNGDVLALSGGFSFKLSEFNRAVQAKDSQDQHLNLLYTWQH